MLKITNFTNKTLKHATKGVLCVSLKKKHVWTSDNIVKSPFQDVVIPNVTVAEYVWRNLDKWPTKTAMICSVTNRQYTYEEIYKQSQVLGANLRKKFKIDNGDAVAIMLPNLPEYLTAVIGILNAGGLVTTLNPNYSAHEVQRQVSMSDTKLIFVTPEVVSTVKKALVLCKRDIPIVEVNFNGDLQEGTISFKELVEDKYVDLNILKEVKRSAEDVAFLPYSSGTTGLPKGVELTNRNIIANAEQQNKDFRFYAYTTDSHQDNLLVCLPMFHSYGLSILAVHKFSVGLKLVTLPKFHPETFVRALSKYNFNLLYLAPPIVIFLGTHPQVVSKYFEHLRCVACGAAPLPMADIERFLSKVPDNVHFSQAYGLTETGPLATAYPIGHKNYKKVGFALPNIELRVIDGNFNNVGPNKVGELLIKGPNVMKGYKENPEANKQVFVDDVWLKTGDLAEIDEFGAVTIADRLKELIKVNAFQVPPAELECVCKEHPAVYDVAVVGIPDAKSGQRPKAFIVLKENIKVSDIEILEFVAERVAPYKRIKEISFIEAIPKNPSGKILRRVLLEKYC
ncbi:unnamed protein product [Parnassius mnemosyne]|uniref:4-coumarate--CoA ligase n=1 Tax=Parnassius mnemosyne TaxID=213953 RepID=A0AAV1KL25_9NEOP